jgi:spore maturation protein CgeB
MTDIAQIAHKMRSDWDRRLALDYRFWMSEAHESDTDMWNAGARDLELLLKGYSAQPKSVVVELGCGVGRLLQPASKLFSKVIGVDISEEAVRIGQELLKDALNVEFLRGNGVNLEGIDSNSVDLVYSYATLGCLPVTIFSLYLAEINRVLNEKGEARLQIYLGSVQNVGEQDTLQLRSYERESFFKAMQCCGFSIESISELSLHFEVSVRDLGLVATLVCLKKVKQFTGNAEEISYILNPHGEPTSIIEPDMGLESWMVYQHACKLIKNGDAQRAKKSLEYALGVAKADSTDIQDLLTKIAASYPASNSTGTYYENIKILERLFPEVALQIKQISEEAVKKSEVTTELTSEGPVLFSQGQPLDHPTAPVRGAQKWVSQTQIEGNDIFVFGFASGYHLEALQQDKNRKISVWEPDITVFDKVLRSRDLRKVFSHLQELWIGTEILTTRFTTIKGSLCVRPQTQSLFPELAAQLIQAVKGSLGLSLFRPTFSVLGPLQGGTLPFLHYVHQNLGRMGQRSRTIDMSVFAGAYGHIDSSLKSDGRKAGLHQQMMTFFAQYITNILQESPVDILLCMALAPVSPDALKAIRSSGIITVLWFVEDHLRFTYWKQYAQCYDYVFTIQRGACMKAFQEAGLENVHYLPCACDPTIHKPLQLTSEELERFGSPISFVGAGYHNRRTMFIHLADLPFRIWGTEWPEAKPYDRLVAEGGRRVSPEEYVKIFNATAININLHSNTERDGVEPGGDFVNPRTFELAASGAFQLVDARVHLPECFAEGKEVIVFRNLEELKQQINYYLEHEDERKIIADRARKRALQHHTYETRLIEMLRVIYADKFNQLKERHESNGWLKMMKRLEPASELYKRCFDAYERGSDPILDSLAAGIMLGKGDLSETEQKLLFLYHIRQQMVMLKEQEVAQTGRRLS